MSESILGHSRLCLERAAALSYTAVVSLVAAAAVSLAFLSALPQSDLLRSDVEDLLTLYLLPNAGGRAPPRYGPLLQHWRLEASSQRAEGCAGIRNRWLLC